MKITSKSTKNMSEANEIELKDSETSVCMKKPKRILHFSDGVLEEYSESETDEQPTVTDSVVSTPPDGWGPWLYFKLKETGGTALAACDYVGEALASFLGITSPKYQYELEEYQRMVAKKMEAEAKAEGWSQPANGVVHGDITTEQPLNNSPTPV